MTPFETGALALASVAAGAANAAAGGGSLITFPTLVAIGFTPLQGNVTNTVGLVPGYAGGVAGYRRELSGQRQRVEALAIDAVLGAVVGVTILLTAPPSAFKIVVPFLVAGACVLLFLQPRIAAAVKRREAERAAEKQAGEGVGRRLHALVFIGSVYGAYFGGALGVILLAVLGLVIDEDMQRINALKGTISFVTNAVAALGFAIFADVQWWPAAVVAVGSVVGGFSGASLARKVKPDLLRRIVAIAGMVVAVRLAISAFT